MNLSWSMDVINLKVFRGFRNQELHNRLCQMYSGASIEYTFEMGIFKLSRIDKMQVFHFYVFATILFVYKCILARPHLKCQCG
jgi:hypothetical protein